MPQVEPRPPARGEIPPSPLPEQRSSLPEQPFSLPEPPLPAPEQPLSLPEQPLSLPEQPLSLPEQPLSLLSTKLSIPPLRPALVDRPRLNRLLQSGLSRALTLVSAPAGYGKTTLVSSWLHAAGMPFAWLSLDEGDNDPARLLSYLAAAVRAVLPPGRGELSALLQHPGADGFIPAANMLIDAIASSASPFVLVLDDFHLLQAPPALRLAAYLLERMPAQMHLALLTRLDPPMPLARLRGRGELVEIRLADLSFTAAEAADFLQRVMGLSLSAADITALEERTEGWIAGLQLAAIAVQGRSDPHASVAAFTGSHAYIIDYLTEEALNRQPEAISAFLLQTSILSSLCGSLCASVTAAESADAASAEAGSGQAILEALERMNLFIIPLDERRQWYRYHHLFADVLQLRLERQHPALVPELHRRASAWYERRAAYPEAIRHALKAGDPERLANLIEQNGCGLILSGESYTLLGWVAAVDALAQSRPWLATLKAWALALTGDLAQVEPALQTAERLIAGAQPVDEVRIVRGSILTIRAYLATLQADPPRAAESARAALAMLPDGNEFACNLRSIATSLYGDASCISGQLEDARAAYVEAVSIGQASGSPYTPLIAQINLGEVLAAQGRLHPAAAMFRAVLQAAAGDNGRLLPLADRALIGLGRICYEWNDLATAGGHTAAAIDLCRQWGSRYLLAEALLLQARLERAGGEAGEGRAALAEVETLAGDPALARRQSRALRLSIAHEWLLRGSPERAELWLRREEAEPSGPVEALEPVELLRMRLLLDRGEYEAALSASDRLLSSAEPENGLRQVIEILILQALAFQEMRRPAQAQESLEKALALAEPEEFTSVFLDEGTRLAKLILQRRRSGGDGWLARLHAQLRGATGPNAAPQAPSTLEAHPAARQALIQPLTAREIEILKLIAAGCSNQAIGAQLYISLPTVKRHISNIYTKLGAKNRTQAVAAGRELGII